MTITAKSCAEFLRSYNDWRRGGEGPQLEPKEIGLNLDFAVEVLEFQHNFLAQITDAAAADDISILEQEARQMRARMERLEQELEVERSLYFRNQVAELEKQRDELLAALEAMNRAYILLMENGRDRISDLGGECDPLDVMERSDPALRESRAVIASVKGGAA